MKTIACDGCGKEVPSRLVALVDGGEVYGPAEHDCRRGGGGDELVIDVIAVGHAARAAGMPAPQVCFGRLTFVIGANGLRGRPLAKTRPRVSDAARAVAS